MAAKCSANLNNYTVHSTVLDCPKLPPPNMREKDKNEARPYTGEVTAAFYPICLALNFIVPHRPGWDLTLKEAHVQHESAIITCLYLPSLHEGAASLGLHRSGIPNDKPSLDTAIYHESAASLMAPPDKLY